MMLKKLFNMFKKSTAINKATKENVVDLEKILDEVENKKEMKMLMKDFYTRIKMDKGGGSSSSPLSSS